ncbi:MAG TPA: NAD-dependent epimerase/dehydratase family protein [Clostridiaceae bacterium]
MNQYRDKLKLLILGGTGFLSGTLAKKAILEGYEVWTLSRGINNVSKDGRKLLIADRHDKDTFKKVILAANTRWDAIIDCIGMVPEDARQDIEVLSGLTKHIIFISSDSVYSPLNRKYPQNEESGHYLTEGYGGNKHLCEIEFLNSHMGQTVWTILRPGHIYGPGSKLGCFPTHVRDIDLITKIREGTTISLVGGGHFLQQPIFAPDLCALMLSFLGNNKTYNQIFCVGGPELIESKKYYELIGDILDTKLVFSELPVATFYAEHPDSASFLCHRIYDLSKLKNSGGVLPSTCMKEGLRLHVESLL